MSWIQNGIIVPLILAYFANLTLSPLPSLSIGDLSVDQQKWHQSGEMIEVGPYQVFYKMIEYNGSKAKDEVPTIVIVHGFPSSSFDYHKVDLSQLAQFGNVLLYDQIGFGFSDKPTSDFTYSIFELADYATMLFQQLKLTDIALISHDMGDTVCVELLKRQHRGILPAPLRIVGNAFTNGGMNFKYAQLRLAQWALRMPFGLGQGFNRFVQILSTMTNGINDRSYHEIAGRAQSMEDRLRDIGELHAMNRLNGGHLLYYKTIYYLYDRDHFEYGWHQALKAVQHPVFVVWGNDDAVAPAIIGSSIAELTNGAQLRTAEEVGHFLMLEDAEFWTRSMVEFVGIL